LSLERLIRRKILGLFTFLTVMGVLLIFNPPSVRADEDGGIEISGLLIDETLTRSGRDFFYFFNSNWQALPGSRTITVRERQDRGSSTSILISVNDTLVFRTPLNRRPGAVEEAAKQAVARVRKKILYQKKALKELDYY
jgi:curli production assembly/transport component CsgE